MKKRLNLLLMAIVAVSVAVGFAACSNDDDDAPVTPSDKSVEGIWQWTRWEGTEEGSHFVEDYENEEKYQTTYLSRDIYIFESDGTFIEGGINPDEDLRVRNYGTWELIEGETPVILVTKNDLLSKFKTVTMEHKVIELSKDKMVISYVDDSYNTTVTMKRVNSVSGYTFGDTSEYNSLAKI